MADKDELGRRGEDLAVQWAEAQEWTVVARNWRGARGELDVVAVDGDCLVMLEVKTRRSMAMGGPVAAVTPRKVSRLRLLVGEWLGAPERRAPPDAAAAALAGVRDVRIDVLAILWPHGAAPQLTHVRGVG